MNETNFEISTGLFDIIRKDREDLLRLHDVVSSDKNYLEYNRMMATVNGVKKVYVPLGGNVSEDLKEKTKQLIEKRCWREFFTRIPFFDILPPSERDLMNKKVNDSSVHESCFDMPEFTSENVEKFMDDLKVSSHKLFLQKIIDCFWKLSWDHKTNSPVKFTKKIIFHLFYGSFSDSSEYLSSLEDICSIIENKEIKRGQERASRFVKYCGVAGEYDLEYFHLKVCKNGNAHVTFKNMDTLDTINRFMSKAVSSNVLPTPKKK